MEQFKVDKSRVVWVLTVGLTCVLLMTSIKMGIVFFAHPSFGIGILLFLIVVTLIVMPWYMPRFIRVSADAVQVWTLGRRITVPLDEIVSVERRNGSFGSDIRLFGSGGYFGFVGKFRNPERGIYTAYAGNPRKMFWLQTRSQLYLLSCCDCERLIALVQDRITKITDSTPSRLYNQ